MGLYLIIASLTPIIRLKGGEMSCLLELLNHAAEGIKQPVSTNIYVITYVIMTCSRLFLFIFLAPEQTLIRPRYYR